MRLQQIKKYLLRGVVIFIIVYACLSLRMWLNVSGVGQTAQLTVEERNAKRVENLDSEAAKSVDNRAEGKQKESEVRPTEGQKPEAVVGVKKAETQGEGTNEQKPVKKGSGWTTLLVDGKQLIAEQYTDQLFTVQGPYNLSTKIFGNFSSGANGTTRYPIFHDEDSNSDRIVNQMRYVPLTVLEARAAGPEAVQRKKKTILVMTGVEEGDGRLKADNCPVKECEYTANHGRAATADVVVWMQSAFFPSHKRPPNQLWVLYQLESPYHSQSYAAFTGHVNYSATYRHDSTIVTPYYKFVPFTGVQRKPQTINYAAGKTKKVAWFVSNCGARNNRLQFARDLGRHIQVDIYGACGDKQCPRSQANSCFQMMNKDYKFYLAFENSNCRDYITEKFFLNGLHHNVIPIVMGAHPDDYRRAAPEHSYIHVDDFEGPAELAAYLKKLDSDDKLYNEYFEWKGTGEFVNTFWWCRLCTMAHAGESERRAVQVADFDAWWRNGICIDGSWRGR